MSSLEGEFTAAGYYFVMNQDRQKRRLLVGAMNDQYARIDDFPRWQSPERDFLF
jgi:glutathione S-transferase